jgi:integrase
LRRRLSADGPTPASARCWLLQELVTCLSQEHQEPITPETPVARLAEVWFAELAARDRSASTISQYRYRLDRQVLPALGDLPTRKLTVGRVDRHLRAVAAVHGPALARMVRSVLSGMCGLAARQDALDRNPVRDAGPIETPRREQATVLTIAEAARLVAALDTDPVAHRRDLPDLVRMMLATGMRIGEAAALTWDRVDLDQETVTVRGTVLRVKGHGLVVAAQPKTVAGFRTLLMPPWANAMLRRRSPGRPAETVPQTARSRPGWETGQCFPPRPAAGSGTRRTPPPTCTPRSRRPGGASCPPTSAAARSPP